MFQTRFIGFLRGGGCPRGGGNWGSLRIPREDWGTLGNIREGESPTPLKNPIKDVALTCSWARRGGEIQVLKMFFFVLFRILICSKLCLGLSIQLNSIKPRFLLFMIHDSIEGLVHSSHVAVGGKMPHIYTFWHSRDLVLLLN